MYDFVIMRVMNIEERVEKIELRNNRVELDKAWETSKTRILSITILTYILMTLVFYLLDSLNPLTHALVPTVGYVLSTLGITELRRIWQRNNKK